MSPQGRVNQCVAALLQGTTWTNVQSDPQKTCCLNARKMAHTVQQELRPRSPGARHAVIRARIPWTSGRLFALLQWCNQVHRRSLYVHLCLLPRHRFSKTKSGADGAKCLAEPWHQRRLPPAAPCMEHWPRLPTPLHSADTAGATLRAALEESAWVFHRRSIHDPRSH